MYRSGGSWRSPLIIAFLRSLYIRFSFITVFQRSRNKGSGNGVEIFSGCRFVWLLKFVAPTRGIRELLWFPPKSANFPKICDTRCWKGKHCKSFSWTCDSAAVDNVTVDGGIVTGRNYRFVWLPEFIALICSVRELLLLTIGVSAAVAFTTKSLSKFICKIDKCYPQFNSTALYFI